MPVYKVVLIYQDQTSELEWSLSNHVTAASAAAAFALADTWNTAYMGLCSANVRPAYGFVSDVAVYRDMLQFNNIDFTTIAGALPANTNGPNSLAALLRLFPTPGQGAVAHRWLHGICENFLVNPNGFALLDPAAVAVRNASLTYFKLYRADATAHFPAVLVPAAFMAATFATTFFDRKLGRPFLLNGQVRG